MHRIVIVTLTAVLFALLPAGSAQAATQVGKTASVKGTFVKTVKVRVTLRSNDSIRVCLRGKSVLPIAVGQWRTSKTRGSVKRHGSYKGAGCTAKKNFAAGTVVRYRACFADPRALKKLYCGKWRKAKAV